MSVHVCANMHVTIVFVAYLYIFAYIVHIRTYLKKMRGAICYKMNVSRASGALCGSVFGCFSVLLSTFLATHLSSKDAQRDLLQNERLESFWGGLWLGTQPLLPLSQTKNQNNVKTKSNKKRKSRTKKSNNVKTNRTADAQPRARVEARF